MKVVTVAQPHRFYQPAAKIKELVGGSPRKGRTNSHSAMQILPSSPESKQHHIR